jgi:hypothetical protein
LPGQRRAVERALALHHLARLAGGVARARREHGLLDDLPRLARVLLEEPAELLVDDALDDALDLGRDELVLWLVAELRVGVLDRDDRRQALADVVSAEAVLQVLEQPGRLRVGVHGARERRAEAREVRAAVLVLDVVREAVDRLLVGVVPLHGDVDLRALGLAQHGDGLVVDDGLRRVEVGDELRDAALELELVRLVGALVADRDRQAAVQVGELAQALREDLKAELRALEDLGVGLEGDLRARLLRLADGLDGRHRVAAPVLLVERLAVALDLELEELRQRVDDGHADAVESARDLVVRVVELTARVQHRHDDLGRRALLRRVLAHGDAASVVLHGNGAVEVDRDVDAITEAGQRLVDGVVDDLVHHVVQTGAVVRVPDVHAGALADGFEALEDLDALFVVRVGRRRPGRLVAVAGWPAARRIDRCGHRFSQGSNKENRRPESR